MESAELRSSLLHDLYFTYLSASHGKGTRPGSSPTQEHVHIVRVSTDCSTGPLDREKQSPRHADADWIRELFLTNTLCGLQQGNQHVDRRG